MATSEVAEQHASCHYSRKATICTICKDWYKDPRSLSCSHTFCLPCLQELMKKNESVNACPRCMKETIPKKEVSSLPLDGFSSHLVCLAQQHSIFNRYAESASDQNLSIPKPIEVQLNLSSETKILKPHDESDGRSALEDQVVGSDRGIGSRSAQPDDDDEWTTEMDAKIQNMASLISHMGDSSDMFTALFTAHMRDMLKSIQGRTTSETVDPGVHVGVNCDKCQKSGFIGNRYKCGMCFDYDLCQECFPQHEEFHDESHLFIKLKRRAFKIHSQGRAINMHASAMYGQCIAHDSKTHINIVCDNCRRNPIIGHRFKCGLCEDYDLCSECEEKSEEIHQPNHTFVVIPNEVRVRINTPLQKKFFF